MKPITLEWIEKAEGDWATLTREYRARTKPNYDAVCFHAQQCAEKYLKARLQEAGIAFAKTHDLEKLLADLLFLEPDWHIFRNEAIALTSLAVEIRYPGMKAIKSDAETAVKHCRAIRKTVRQSLNLPVFK
jgi:HEPN domain-containing protein